MTFAAAKNRAHAVHTVTAAQAKVQLSALLKRVLNGERITITHYNRPVADLVPTTIAEPPAPKFGTLKGKVRILDPNWHKGPETDEELEAWLEGRFE
jgi:prevent-host-death family protein